MGLGDGCTHPVLVRWVREMSSVTAVAACSLRTVGLVSKGRTRVRDLTGPLPVHAYSVRRRQQQLSPLQTHNKVAHTFIECSAQLPRHVPRELRTLPVVYSTHLSDLLEDPRLDERPPANHEGCEACTLPPAVTPNTCHTHGSVLAPSTSCSAVRLLLIHFQTGACTARSVHAFDTDSPTTQTRRNSACVCRSHLSAAS
jgi:hypothetical protein